MDPYFFFFSSRRRHTRFDCDWSSDVCSSDLDLVVVGGDDPVLAAGGVAGGDPAAVDPVVDAGGGHAQLGGQAGDRPLAWRQAGEGGGPSFGPGADAVLADQGADLSCGEPAGPLGRPEALGMEGIGDLPAVPACSGELG